MFKSFWLNCFLTRLPTALTLYINTVGAESSQSDKFSQVCLTHNKRLFFFVRKNLYYVPFVEITTSQTASDCAFVLQIFTKNVSQILRYDMSCDEEAHDTWY